MPLNLTVPLTVPLDDLRAFRRPEDNNLTVPPALLREHDSSGP
jgi:hypothetical protein